MNDKDINRIEMNNPIKAFKEVLFALNNEVESEDKLIEFLQKQGLKYEGKQNYNKYGCSRENVFTYGDNFKLVISWMRNLSTVQYNPDGWDGAFTEVYFDNIRKCSTEYYDHNSLAFCSGEYEMLKLAIPYNNDKN